MLGRIVFATALTLAAVTMASAQGQGDARERAACRPDVMRFCKQVIKDTNDDVFSILSCVGCHNLAVVTHQEPIRSYQRP